MACEFQQYFREEVLEVNAINHKGNNQLFEVITSKRKYLLKRYSTMQRDCWNRGRTEFNALSNFYDMGIKGVPYPIRLYDDTNIGIYSFESGKTLEPEEVDRKHVLEASNFLCKLHGIPLNFKNMFPLERTFCLSIADYSRLIEKRYADIVKDFYGTGDSKKFLESEVYPRIKEIEKSVLDSTDEHRLGKKLTLENQAVNPGDFGFHNMLASPDKNTFIDFEYCGRDDPAKQILDFIHHDRNKKLDPSLKNLFVQNYSDKMRLENPFRERLKLLDPFIGMNWTLIYLNVLSKKYLEHLKFANGDLGNVVEERVEKARAKIENLRYFGQ